MLKKQKEKKTKRKRKRKILQNRKVSNVHIFFVFIIITYVYQEFISGLFNQFFLETISSKDKIKAFLES